MPQPRMPFASTAAEGMSSSAMTAPFAQAMEQARTMAEEFTRMFSEIRMPAMPEVETLLATYRRNLEALSAANRVALDGAQAVARRHMEIMQQTMSELSDTIRQLGTTDGPQARAAKQADLLKQAYERAVQNSREMSDLIQRTNAEAVQVLNRRFTEAMDEIKTLMDKAKQAGQAG